MSERKTIDAKRISIAGILTALTVICLFFATTLPTGRLSLYALSSFTAAIIVLEFGIGAGWLFYAATSLLAFFLLFDKVGLLPYVLFFGLYGIVKCYIEKLRKLVIEYILKLLAFNVLLAAVISAAKEFLIGDISARIPWWAVIAGLQVIFIVYDYAYTLFIQYYNQRLKTLLKL